MNDKNNEYFVDIPRYYGMYQVSNLGNVKSVERYIKRPNGLRINKERILKPSISSSGYFIVSLSDGNKIKTRAIHQLVAETFLNHIPNKHVLLVNHKNQVRTDNFVDNLEIVTARENTNQKHLKSSSKYVGVSFHKLSKKWQSRIVIEGNRNFLGYFNCELDAHHAYQKALKNISW